MKKFKPLLAIVLLSFLLTSILLFWLARPTFRIVRTWEKPMAVDYKSSGPYYFHIVEDNLDFGHIPFTLPRNYFLYVGKDQNEIRHGHVKNYSFEYHNDIDQYLEKCSVEWTPEGVTFTEPGGHVFFMPKDSFIGGR